MEEAEYDSLVEEREKLKLLLNNNPGRYKKQLEEQLRAVREQLKKAHRDEHYGIGRATRATENQSS